MGQRIWCAIAGRRSLIHVDATHCNIVYELKKVAVNLSDIRIPYIRVDIWKVKYPEKWPAANNALLNEILDDDDGLCGIAELLYPHTELCTIFDKDISDTNIEIIMQIRSKRRNLPSIPVPERFVWCADTRRNRLFEVDIAKCKDTNSLKKAIARDGDIQDTSLDVWKLRDPERWPVNDKARKEIFPRQKSELDAVSEQLNTETMSIPLNFFDDKIRMEHIYLFVQAQRGLKRSKSSSTFSSYQKRLAWCAVYCRTRLFQLNITDYDTISDLCDAALKKSGFKASNCQVWKVKNPILWPVNNESHNTPIASYKGTISKISELHKKHELVDTVFCDPLPDDSLHIILYISEAKAILKPVPAAFTSFPPPVPERTYWCAVSGLDQVMRVNSHGCRFVIDLQRAVVAQGQFDLTEFNISLWKVKDPQKWMVEDIVTGSVDVPESEEELEEIAVPLYAPHVPDVELQASPRMDCVYLIMQILTHTRSLSCSVSSTSSASGSDPFIERDDVKEALKELGFHNEIFQDMDRWHVADVFSDDGERYVVKYLRPGRCDEIDVLGYLSRFDSPLNHAPSSVISYRLNEGALLLMRHYGKTVCDYAYLSRDLLAITRQLLEGVAFLHSKLVVHMDLKLSHIVIDKAGRLWIIDFDLSEIMKSPDELVTGFRGTKGCTAPEVGRSAYNPFLADAWAVGKMVRDLCNLCAAHKDRSFLKKIGTSLTVRDPRKRSSIQGVYAQLVEYITDVESQVVVS